MAKLSFSVVECQKAQTQPLMLSTFFQHSVRKTFSSFAGLSPFSVQLPRSMKHNHDDLENNFWLWRRTNQNEKNKIAMHMPPALHFPTPCCLVSLTSCMPFQWRLQLFVTKHCCPFATTWWWRHAHQPNSSAKFISSSGSWERIPKVKTLSKVAAIPQLQTDD
jgi:hypothetical protein